MMVVKAVETIIAWTVDHSRLATTVKIGLGIHLIPKVCTDDHPLTRGTPFVLHRISTAPSLTHAAPALLPL